MLEEVGFKSASGNPTFMSLSKEEIRQNKMTILNIFNFPNNHEFELIYLFWILKTILTNKDIKQVPVNVLRSVFLNTLTKYQKQKIYF